jgi:hypothetical protein
MSSFSSSQEKQQSTRVVGGFFQTISAVERFFKSLFQQPSFKSTNDTVEELEVSRHNISGNTSQASSSSSSPSSAEATISTMNFLDEMDKSSQAYLSDLRLSLQKRTCPQEDCILTESLAKQLRRWMPARCRFSTSWSLIYSSAQHGFSLHTLYNLCKSTHNSMLVVKDDQGCIFGAFASNILRPQIGHFGNGECFLWKTTTASEEDREKIVQVYLSTGKDPYFIIAEPEFLAIGCGDGKFGLLLDHDLLNGQSNPVPTFNNEILASDRDFVCLGVEVWKFDASGSSIF